mgnify:CR=1 FL=1
MRAADPSMPLLVVEDSDEDYAALRWALGKLGVSRRVERCASADELFAYLRGTVGALPEERGAGAPAPALILLDLNLMGDDGREVLAMLKGDPALRRIPVVVWTTSAHPADVAWCYDRGASGYTVKPVDVPQLLEAMRSVTDYWFGCVLLPEVGGREGGAGQPGGSR